MHALFTFTTKDIIQVSRQLLAQRVAFQRVGRQQRGYDRAGVNLRSSLGEILEEIDQPIMPDRVKPNFLAHVHEDFIDEDECRQALPSR